ncbi:hypothetical protein RRF57_006495 [Xylaria bambusicola]|uniref:Ecp2 effector protein-like domain-containing protein n=1 Tax=Xylaria bambusicola TaxID=326684 RepID=A0AAN7UEF0_9PEZI
MKLHTFLPIPLAALVAHGITAFKILEPAPFAPATPEQGTFAKCSAVEHHKGKLAHPADMLDCLEISTWASTNNGMWVLKATTEVDDDDDDGWHVLNGHGTCALFVKYTAPTSIGNADVVNLIEAIHMSDSIELGSVEEVGTFRGCQAGVDVSFWLRGQ